MLFWALLNLRVLLRAPAKRAMRGRAVHACSPIDAALMDAKVLGAALGDASALHDASKRSRRPGRRYAKTALIEKDTAAPTHSCSESCRSVAAPSLHEQLRGW